MGIKVTVRSKDDIDKVLNRFRRKCDKEGIFDDIKNNMYFEKPCDKRRRHERKIKREKEKQREEEEWRRQHSVL